MKIAILTSPNQWFVPFAKRYLKHKYNIVIHASDLPKDKGWAPMFWQILEDKNTIPFTMFEASSGEEIFYKKRESKDSKLDIDKTIKEQFNLLRIVNNENYPAFFELDGYRYVLKIELDKMGGVSLLDFVDLTLKEKEMVLSWRNHKDIKRWMYNTKSIELNEHLRYIDTLELSKTKQYIVVKKDSEYVGVIDFTNIDFKNNSVDFGLYANPNKKIAGIGRVLEEACIKYAFDILGLEKLKLEVFSENTRAMNLYKKFDFKEIGKKIFNNKNVICMELKNNYN